jgi:hypothetical protein
MEDRKSSQQLKLIKKSYYQIMDDGMTFHFLSLYFKKVLYI